MKGLRWIFAFLRDPTGALVGVGYVLFGLWFGLEGFFGLTAASFVLGALFLSFSAVPLMLLNRMCREPISTDEPR